MKAIKLTKNRIANMEYMLRQVSHIFTELVEQPFLIAKESDCGID